MSTRVWKREKYQTRFAFAAYVSHTDARAMTTAKQARNITPSMLLGQHARKRRQIKSKIRLGKRRHRRSRRRRRRSRRRRRRRRRRRLRNVSWV